MKTVFSVGLTKNRAYRTDLQNKGDDIGIGSLRIEEDGSVYRWVQNMHTAALAAGDVVFHTFSDGVDAHKYVRDGATADLGFMAGVVKSTSIALDSTGSAGDGGYGWIQVLGYNASAKVLPDTNATPAAGATLIGVNAQVYVDGQSVTAMGTAPIYGRYLLLLEAVTIMTTPAATATKVWVSCYK